MTAAPIASVVPLIPAWRVDKEFDYVIPAELVETVEPGALVRVPFGSRRVRGVVMSVRQGDATDLQPLAAVVTAAPVAPPPLPDVYRYIADRYVVALGAALARSVPPRVRVRPQVPSLLDPPIRPLLDAYEGGPALLDAISTGRSGTWSLRTLPDERPGELLVGLVESARRAGRSSLVAVPEVRYTSGVVTALEDAFGRIARVDSSTEDQERSRAWLSLARGHPVGVGGRGVVLAPARDLGLMVLEDEGHPSYKDDRSPRFDARRVAIERARRAGAVCVLMSSAPSVFAGAAARAGTFLSVAPGRALERAHRPLVEVIEPPSEGGLSVELQRRIKDTLAAGASAGLLIPQRGYSRAIWCESCRRSVRCPLCEAGTIYHRESRSIRCPRCASVTPAPDTCPTCGASDFRYLGTGSHRLAEQLAKAFPRTRVLRMDPEVAPAQAQEFPEGPLVYVATYFGVKPALRPPVSLVGVVDADHLIRMPDYAASERAFSLLTEMAGWSGPAGDGGRLVIQTAEPRHHAVQAVVRADYSYFLERELEQRRELSYPPFAELVRLTASGPDADAVLGRAAEAARLEGARVLGPIDVRRRGVAGREALLKCPDAGRVALRLRVILPDVPKGTTLSVDVDPH